MKEVFEIPFRTIKARRNTGIGRGFEQQKQNITWIRANLTKKTTLSMASLPFCAETIWGIKKFELLSSQPATSFVDWSDPFSFKDSQIHEYLHL